MYYWMDFYIIHRGIYDIIKRVVIHQDSLHEATVQLGIYMLVLLIQRQEIHGIVTVVAANCKPTCMVTGGGSGLTASRDWTV